MTAAPRQGERGATQAARSPEEEIAAVASRIEGIAASHLGGIEVTLKLCARRLRVALLLGAHIRQGRRP